MSLKVVVVGGGLGGCLVAKLLESDAEVTLIDSKDFLEIRWAILRALVDPSVAPKVFIPHSEYLNKTKIIKGTAKSANGKEVVLADGTVVPYDFLVVATGSKPDEYGLDSTQKIEYFKSEHDKIKAAKSILIVGGGPVGVEFAGEVLTEFPDKKVTIVHSKARLMEFAKPKASEKALKWLQSKNVEVLLNDKVDAGWDKFGSSGSFKTQSGKEILADYLFIGIGGKPDVSWLADSFSGALDGDSVKVDSELRLEGQSNIFVIGDATNIKEAKQGYFAQIHARQTAANLKKLLKDDTAKGLKTYKAGPDIAFISLGRKQGIAQLPFGTFMGFLPTTVKSKDLFVSTVRKELGLAA